MSINAGLAIWKTAFQVSPIIFVDGISSFMPGGMLPLVAITEAINTPLGLLGGINNSDLDNFFAAFAPMSGGTILEQDIARYPFANQVVAANAVIGLPLKIAMLMICPARGPFGYYEKLAVITALQAAMNLHNRSGGRYHVATPSYIYTNCIFRRMTDVSSGHSKQPQSAWMLEFEQPLVTLSDAQSAQSSVMGQLTQLLQINAGGTGAISWGGVAASIPTTSLAGPSAITTLQGVTQGLSTSTVTAPIASSGV